LGLLGADFEYDPETGSYRIVGMLEGDSWDPDQDSPLRRPGLGLRVGDRLLALNGRRLGPDLFPAQVLVNQAGLDVQLRVIRDGQDKSRIVSVRTLSDDTRARYRQWVAANRRRVHDLSRGRVGYLHIPNMGPQGYAEFHRGYLAEVDRPGLLVDVRFNGGGHVSPLLLEKLSRRRLAYDVQRWGQPIPYPQDSPRGAMAALTNELAGSDGDIFSHVFKMMKLGPLVGKRTWGGVIGVWPRHRLVDGTVTTQPEFAFWFADVGWGVENHGTEPDVVVEFPPQDFARGRDPQLEKAVEIVLEQIRQQEAQGPPLPDWETRPHRVRPPLR
jgi:tricorn protease